MLITGLVLAVPIFVISMGKDFGLLPERVAAFELMPWILAIIATAVQFYVGWQYYVGGYKSLRNSSANMDLLVAIGSSAAYGYSMGVMLAPFLGLQGLGAHLYFETSSMIIVLIRVGKYMEARAKGRASDAIRKLLSLQAKKARIVRDGIETDIRLDNLVVGDRICLTNDFPKKLNSNSSTSANVTIRMPAYFGSLITSSIGTPVVCVNRSHLSPVTGSV